MARFFGGSMNNLRNMGCWVMALIFLILGACGDPLESGSKASEAESSTQTDTGAGIDVSHYSGAVDWLQVMAGGNSFAFAKATEGVDYTDPAFATNWANMKTANITRGAYHFYVVDDDPGQQAQNFIQNVILSPGDLPPVVDVESPGSIQGEALGQNILTWLGIIEDHYGVTPMIYTDSGFWNEYVAGDFSQYPLWIAEFGTQAPTLPNGFDTWAFWQYQEDATVSGVASGADLDVFNGDLEGLKQILVQP